MTPILYVGLDSAAQLSYRGRLHIPIIQTVGSVTGLSPNQITGPRRLQNITDARFIAIHFIRKYTNMSLKHIGRSIGNRNHATIIHAINVFEELYMTDKIFREKADKVESQLIARGTIKN